MPQRFEQADGSVDLGAEGLDRIAVGMAHEGLRGEMDDDLRTRLLDEAEEALRVAKVAEPMLPILGQTSRMV